MKRVIPFLLLLSMGNLLFAQSVFTIRGDSVKITNKCDSSELILENHTQSVQGFLFNKGRGRTEFRKALTKISDSIYLIGGDTLRTATSAFWAANGSHIYNINSGNVGIHRTDPIAMLDLPGPVNVDDTSSYRIGNVPVLRIGDNEYSGYLALTVGAGTGSANSGLGITFVGGGAGAGSAGDYNTFVGASSGANSTVYNGISGHNSFFGSQSGTGSHGGNNTFLGYSSGNALSGNNNTAAGYRSGLGSVGDHNIYMGDSTGAGMTGSSNTFIGTQVGKTGRNLTGVTLIGGNADASASNLVDATAIGYNAKVGSSYTMVFGDDQVNTWVFNANATVPGDAALVVGSNSSNGNGAYLTTGGVWTNASDRWKKENFQQLDNNEILAKIDQLPVTRWNYIGTKEQHIGPVAQDFYRIFHVGTDDKTITTIDPSGIALAGIQGLYKKWQQAEMQVIEQQRRLDEQQSLIKDQRIRINELRSELESSETDISNRRALLKKLQEKIDVLQAQLTNKSGK